MMMEERLEKIKNDIQAGIFKSEKEVVDKIIKALLHELGWDIFDSEEVCEEYSVGEGRVDIALRRKNQSLIFIEAKKIGNLNEGGLEQLFLRYAFHEGVEIGILTDGREWHFYLPLQAGKPHERQFFQFNLAKDEIEMCARKLERYLQKSEVINGSALENAKADYQTAKAEQEILKILPEAWKKLVADKDSILVDSLAEKIENLCGHRPENSVVWDFLKSLKLQKSVNEFSENQKPIFKNRDSFPQNKFAPTRKISGGRCGFEYQGKYYSTGSARETAYQIIKTLFPDGDLSRINNKIRYAPRTSWIFISDDMLKLFPLRSNEPDWIRRNCEEIFPGWYIAKNYYKENFEKSIQRVCEEINIRYGKDLIVNWGDKK